MADVETAPSAERDTSERRIASGVRDVVVAAPLFITAPLYRRWHLRWGATDEEVAGPMPGDDVVAKTSFNATRAISIDAPPDQVWPWIVQIGFGRAGFYSYDLFDNLARPSADRILPEYQNPWPGDWVPMAGKVNETTAFKIAGFRAAPVDALAEAGEHLGLEARSPPRRWNQADNETQGGTTTGTRPPSALLTVVLFEWGDFPMMRIAPVGSEGASGGLRPHGRPRGR